MGYINKLTCQCGYKKEIMLGSGRQLPDMEYIRENFSKEKLTRFHAAADSGCLGPVFYIENIMARCSQCNDIKTGKVLHFQESETEITVSDVCHTCGGDLEPLGDPPLCPKCGKPLNVQMNGLWD